MKKILSHKFEIVVLIILLVVFSIARPKFVFLQKLSLFLNDKKVIKENNLKMGLYRNNPGVYFKILEKKQKANLGNLYLKYFLVLDLGKDEHGKEKSVKTHGEIYAKNSIRKEKSRTNFYMDINMPTMFEERVTKGRVEYYYNATYLVPTLTKRIAMSTGVNIFNMSYKPKDFEYIRYKGRMTHNTTKNICALWEMKAKPQKKNQNLNEINEMQICVDENLGFIYYANITKSSNEKAVLNIQKVEYDVVKNEDIMLPKEGKFILDLVWLQRLVVLFSGFKNQR